MSTLDALVGLEHYLVSKHLSALRHCPDRTSRWAYLGRVQSEDGERIREFVEAAFREFWADRTQEVEP